MYNMTEYGHMFYEAEYELDGVAREVKVTEDGHIVAYEQQIPPSGLPRAVVARIQELFPDAEIEEAELAAVNFYEIELEADGREHELKS